MLREFPAPPLQAAATDADGTAGPAVPRDAATVVLVRDGEEGVELFLLRRAASMAFAAGMCVFPGGVVDPRDAVDDVPWEGPDPAAWAEQLAATPMRARAFVCAAVRETFEECGVLLAGDGPTSVLEGADGPQWEADRQRLLTRELAMSDLLRRRDLVLRADLLRPWAHWTTPVHEPRRYDTRFLIAVLPPGQTARHVGGESEESGWWPAARVLERAERGEIAMLPPTLVTVEEAARAPDARTLWSSPRVVREVLPVLRRRGTRDVVVADLPEQP